VSEDALFSFAVEGAPVRGRLARLSPSTVDAILKRHAYPRPVALLLGEALALAALFGGLAKAAHRITLQAEGDGPCTLLVAEWRADGSLRAYARLGDDCAARVGARGRMAPWELLGQGALAVTLDLGPDTDQLQGYAPLEGATLSECAEDYFTRSEQTPTRVKLACVEEIGPGGTAWVAGGALIQRVAGDDARGFTDDDWERAQYLFATLEDAELVDPRLSAQALVYRLFHEDGVRMDEGRALADRCTCDAGRLTAVLSRFTAEELSEFVEPDGLIHAKCQFCARTYRLTPQEVVA
jgi:molecular chaperone Hsp33